MSCAGLHRLNTALFFSRAGDFIYADVPLYFGDDEEAYRRLYRRNYNSPSFRKVYEKLRELFLTCLVRVRMLTSRQRCE
jgi:hypothetical protein